MFNFATSNKNNKEDKGIFRKVVLTPQMMVLVGIPVHLLTFSTSFASLLSSVTLSGCRGPGTAPFPLHAHTCEGLGGAGGFEARGVYLQRNAVNIDTHTSTQN